MAGFAIGQRLDGNRLLDPGECFFERQFEIVAKVRAAGGTGPLCPRIHEFAEDRRENVGKALETSPAGGAERALTVHPVLESGMAKAVIGGALLRVLEDVIGLADRLEVSFLVGASAMAVGMAVHRQLAIGSLDRLVVGAACDAEQLIIVRG